MNLFKRKRLDSKKIDLYKNKLLDFINADEQNIKNFDKESYKSFDDEYDEFFDEDFDIGFFQFVSEYKDKFKEESFTKIRYPDDKYSEYQDVYSNSCLTLSIRAVNSPNSEQIFIDYICDTFISQFSHMNKGKMNLNKGKMIVRINDNVNISLFPKLTNFDSGDSTSRKNIEEGYYLISKDQLKQISDAKTIEVKIYGESIEHLIIYQMEDYTPSFGEMNNILPAERFLFMCRAFYTGFYKERTYLEWIYNILK